MSIGRDASTIRFLGLVIQRVGHESVREHFSNLCPPLFILWLEDGSLNKLGNLKDRVGVGSNHIERSIDQVGLQCPPLFIQAILGHLGSGGGRGRLGRLVHILGGRGGGAAV